MTADWRKNLQFERNMYKRVNIVEFKEFDKYSDYFKKVAFDAAKEGEIRRIKKEPIPDDRTLRILCMYLLMDKPNIVVVDLNKRRRVENITSVPLCFHQAMTDYGYIKSVLGNGEYAYRAIAIQLKDTDEETFEDYEDIMSRFRYMSEPDKTMYLLTYRFSIYPLYEGKPLLVRRKPSAKKTTKPKNTESDAAQG